MSKKKSNKKKKDYSGLIYMLSAVITLIIHHFFISKINIHPTFQVAIDLLILTILSGVTINALYPDL